jgi:AraC-like DNA-binding protein
MTGAQGLFGPRISQHFGFRRGPTLAVSAEAGMSIAMTHVFGQTLGLQGAPTPQPEAAFSIMVQLAPLQWHDMALGASPHFAGAVPTGAVSVVDLEDRPSSRISGQFDAVQFYVPRRTLDDLCKDHGCRRIGRLARPRAEPDAAALSMTSLLLPYLHGTTSSSDLFVEHVTTAFLVHAIRDYGDVALADCAKGGLSAWQVRRATDLMQASIASGISITELAGQCRLSERHFATAFKRTLGSPPHRYLTRLRLAEAKRLLSTSDLPLAEIATLCGFGSQSHLTRAFAGAVGTSPGAWRRACKG